jgi:hypothetical protein
MMRASHDDFDSPETIGAGSADCGLEAEKILVAEL